MTTSVRALSTAASSRAHRGPDRAQADLHAGLYMLPMAGMVLVFAPISGRLVSRRGARP